MRLAPLFLACAGLLSAADTAGIPDSVYVRAMPDGTLQADGQRVRLWSVIGSFPNEPKFIGKETAAERAALVARSRADTEVIIQRLIDLGFNGHRLWHSLRGEPDYTPGDGSRADVIDHFLMRLKQRGFRVWASSIYDVGHATAVDAAVIDEPATADAWTAAIAEAGGRMAIQNNPARLWDRRLQALAVQRMTEVATHRNRHTGLRWCDDPLFATWELSNEEWMFGKLVGGTWQKLPAFFQRELYQRWSTWLQARYRDQAGLARAWGSLLPGESLDKGTVLIAPLRQRNRPIDSGDPVAVANFGGIDQPLGREDFAEQRGRDVAMFFVELLVASKERERAALKPLGRSTALCPWIFDTGIGYEIQAQYLQQHADAVVHGAYVSGVDNRRGIGEQEDDVHLLQSLLGFERVSPNDGPWINWLRKPPSISHGVPWLEHNKVAGKPYFCYETQIQQPAKYRADYPMRLASLGAIQDWDWINWHFWGAAEQASTSPRPFDRPLDITTGRHPQGYHFTFDEVQSGAMRNAAMVFRQGLLAPAPTPTVFTYGARSLSDPRSFDYGGSYGRRGLDMLPTTYQHGVRIRIDPQQEADSVSGPVVPFTAFWSHNPYQPAPGQITFDHRAGFLRWQAPAVLGWVGSAGTGEVRVGDSVLSSITFANPAGSPHPIAPADGYLAFSWVADDGKPLTESAHMTIALASTSFNTGQKLAAENNGEGVAGTLPVLVTRVGATLTSPALRGTRWTLLDWHLQELARGQVGDDLRLAIPADRPVWLVRLDR